MLGVERVRVIFHVSDRLRWDRALLNATNLLLDAGAENVEAEILANGPAVAAYTGEKADLLLRMEDLSRSGVKFLACRNALRMQGIAEETLPHFVTVVPAGVTVLATRQREGYAYIKP